MVLTTFDFAVMPNAECLIVTVSQRETLSKIAEYSGCFQSGSNATVSVGVSTPRGFAFMKFFALLRRLFSFMLYLSSNNSVKSFISIFCLVGLSIIGRVISESVITFSVLSSEKTA